jgi:hypothetical protein
MLRAFAFGLIFICISCTETLACPGMYAESTIIFVDVPTSLDAAVVVEATISDISRITDHTGLAWVVMDARIDRVIRGQIDDRTVRIVALETSCTKGFGAGSRGIVAGTLRRDAQGLAELVAIQESRAQRSARKIREGRK